MHCLNRRSSFCHTLRQQRPEYTLLIGFALSVLVFSYVLGLTGQLLEEFAGLQQYLGDAKGISVF